MNKESQRNYDLHSDEIISLSAERFGCSSDSFVKERSFESVVYTVKDSADNSIEKIIKITHSLHRHPDEIASEFDWLDYLAKNGVALAKPLASDNERLIELFTCSDDSVFMVCCFEKIDGIRLAADYWSPAHFRAWGELIGRIHRVSASYAPTEGVRRRHDWRGALLTNDGYTFSADQQVLQSRYLELVEKIEALPEDNSSYGIIHGDLHQGNFLVKNHTSKSDFSLVAFDFDDAHYGRFAHDIAMPLLYSLYAEGVSTDTEKQREFASGFLRDFLAGYASEHTLTPEIVSQIPLFLKLREMDLYYITVHYDLANDDSWLGRFFPGRKERIEAGAPFVDLDFASFI